MCFSTKCFLFTNLAFQRWKYGTEFIFTFSLLVCCWLHLLLAYFSFCCWPHLPLGLQFSLQQKTKDHNFCNISTIPKMKSPSPKSVMETRTTKVVFALPPVGTLFDAKVYLSGFKSGFGEINCTQTQLCKCKYTPYLGCVCAVVECFHPDVCSEVMDFISSTPFLSKYNLDSCIVMDDDDLDMSHIPCEKSENMAAHPLIQYASSE